MAIEDQLVPAFAGLGTVNALGTVSSGTVAVPGPAVAAVTTVTISANTTFTVPAPAGCAGQRMILEITQDATGSRTGTFTGVKFAGGTHTLTTTANATDLVDLECDGTQWVGRLALAIA